MNEVLVECQASALQKINWLLKMENKAPFTSNEPHFSDYREKFLESYRQARLYIHKSTDPYDQALRYMASARAFFQSLYCPFSSLASSELFTRLFSHITAFHGYGPDGDR